MDAEVIKEIITTKNEKQICYCIEIVTNKQRIYLGYSNIELIHGSLTGVLGEAFVSVDNYPQKRRFLLSECQHTFTGVSIKNIRLECLSFHNSAYLHLLVDIDVGKKHSSIGEYDKGVTQLRLSIASNQDIEEIRRANAKFDGHYFKAYI